MKLVPFVSVDGTPFASRPEDVIRARGAPARAGCNGVGLDELDYGEVVFRFQDSGRLEEITTRAPVLSIGTLAVPFRSLRAFVIESDPAAFERAGFVVSPKFGLAFDPESSEAWVTALARHCIGAWRAL